ncbi:MAG: UDP-N-acetylmuramoyl-tripeptide--D-alanyl-D-alanine ligase [Bacteroidales bacterium]|nr:UDP-N-acetylmuramoyl-tripeptide--D-alanyl-D-alanine ligase [Bacteroidales bacterium]
MNDEKIKHLYELYSTHPKISTDSRNIQPNDIFFSMHGETFDGNKFAAIALEKGARCVVIDNPFYYNSELGEGKQILVSDTLQCLQALSRLHRQTLKIPVIGVTGTNGKTTTKELIHAVLATKYKTQATKGNLNNHIGVPLTILSITREYEMAIVEMGANHCGEIAFLCDIAQPNYGLITNIGQAHIEGFGSLEGVIKTKNELFDFLQSHNGFAFVNNDDTNISNRAAELANKLTYSLHHPANITAQVDKTKPYATVLCNGVTLNSNLTGAFNASNILAAVSVGLHFGLDMTEIQSAIANYVPVNRRSQIKKTESNTLILDCYNANPSSVKASLEAFIAMNATGKCVFLGSMKELGSISREAHKAVVNYLKDKGLKRIAFVGQEYEEWTKGNDNMLWFSTSSMLRDWLLQHPISDSTILIKGSRATEMELVETVL